MQRYSDGLEVPKYQMDSFVGMTTDAGGVVTLVLTYKPQSINDILVFFSRITPAKVNRIHRILDLVERTLRVRVYVLTYDQVTSDAIGSSNSGGAGADPHTHAILFYTNVECYPWGANNEAQDPIAVHYKVA